MPDEAPKEDLPSWPLNPKLPDPAWDKAFEELHFLTESASFSIEVYEECRRFLVFVDYWQMKFDPEKFLDVIEYVEEMATNFRTAAEDTLWPDEPEQKPDDA
jgi:hypothetical protein